MQTEAYKRIYGDNHMVNAASKFPKPSRQASTGIFPQTPRNLPPKINTYPGILSTKVENIYSRNRNKIKHLALRQDSNTDVLYVTQNASDISNLPSRQSMPALDHSKRQTKQTKTR